MVATEPNVSPTGRYSIKETYTMLEVSRSTFGRMVEKRMIRCHYRRTVKDRMGNPRMYFIGSDILACWRKY